MLSRLDIALYVVLGILTIFLSSIVSIVFITSKQLRQHPSGLIACISICEVIMAYHSIIFVIGVNQYIKNVRIQEIIILFTFSDKQSVPWLCGINQLILSGATISCICYNIAICLDLVITLYNPLIPGDIRKKWYHALNFIAVVYFTTFVNTVNGFISKCESNQSNRLEIMNTASVGILLLIYLAAGIISIAYAAYRFSSGLKLESKTTRKYLIRHIFYVSLFILCWTWPATSYLLTKYDDINYTIDTIAIACTGCSGFFLGLIRISDPVVWKHIKALYRNETQKNKNGIESDDSWNEPISVVVQSKLNEELTHCIFESLHYNFLKQKAKDQEDATLSDYNSMKSYNIIDHSRPLSVWGVRDSKINGIVLEVYAPAVFADILKSSNITLDEVLNSLDPQNNYQASVDISAGKSGSFFLFTKDRRFSIKTIKKREKNLMINFLKDYHEHIIKFKYSLLCRVYGVFVLKIPGVAAVNILLMENLFYEFKPELVFDIKGSTAGRTSKNKKAYSGPLKDLDFIELNEKLALDQEDIKKIEFNLLKDLKLLKKNKLMDYSMLIGTISTYVKSDKLRKSYNSLDKQKTYHFGIIDFLTEYGYLKSFERSFNALRYGSKVKKVSVANPASYSNRLFNFIFSVVVPVARKNSSILTKDD